MNPRWLMFIAGMVLLLPRGAGAQAASSTLDALRRELAEREAQVIDLRRRIESLQAAPAGERQTAPATTAAAPATRPPQPSTSPTAAGDDEDLSALESALVRQGGAVLPPGTIELDPEFFYYHDHPSGRGRRDGVGVALFARVGLPGAFQAEAYLPYVIRDRQEGVGRSSGVGDVRLGLTHQLMTDSPTGRPGVLVFTRWRIKTANAGAVPSFAAGQHGLQAGLTVTRRMDPVLLLASASYTKNIGSVRLRTGGRFDAGDIWGFRVGANLAATPETSFFWGISYNTSGADRLNRERIGFSSEATGFLELSSTTVLAPGRYLNLGVGIGLTSASPKLNFSVSMPVRIW
jgi:hypothetical protein